VYSCVYIELGLPPRLARSLWRGPARSHEHNLSNPEAAGQSRAKWTCENSPGDWHAFRESLYYLSARHRFFWDSLFSKNDEVRWMEIFFFVTKNSIQSSLVIATISFRCVTLSCKKDSISVAGWCTLRVISIVRARVIGLIKRTRIYFKVSLPNKSFFSSLATQQLPLIGHRFMG